RLPKIADFYDPIFRDPSIRRIGEARRVSRIRFFMPVPAIVITLLDQHRRNPIVRKEWRTTAGRVGGRYVCLIRVLLHELCSSAAWARNWPVHDEHLPTFIAHRVPSEFQHIGVEPQPELQIQSRMRAEAGQLRVRAEIRSPVY